MARSAGQSIAAHGNAAADRTCPTGLDADLRSLPFGRYVVFYAPTADGIDVIRVLHSARDIEGLFDEPA